MKSRLYIGDKLVYEKEMRPESEWKIDPVFLEGVGDDSELVARIKDALRGSRHQGEPTEQLGTEFSKVIDDHFWELVLK